MSLSTLQKKSPQMSQGIKGLHELFLAVKNIQYIHKNSADKDCANVIPISSQIAKGQRSLNKTEDAKLYIQTIESTKDLLGEEYVIGCDLEMDLVLVPKQWVKEMVYKAISDFAYEYTKVLLSEVDFRSNMFPLERAMERVVSILQSQKFSVNDSLEKRWRDCFNILKVGESQIQAFLAGYGIQCIKTRQ